METNTQLTVGTRVKITKGCRAKDVAAHTTAVVAEVKELGADCSHSVRVILRFLNGFQAGKSVVFFARHINRLSDLEVSLNDGNPLRKIKLRRA